MAHIWMLATTTIVHVTGREAQRRDCSEFLRDLFLDEEFNYIFLRSSMIIIFLMFSYTKWHLYAVPILTPIVSHSPILWPLYHELGIRATLRFLGTSEWLIFILLFAGFWDKRLGLL
jgi:uncharacterized membrane protein YkgB